MISYLFRIESEMKNTLIKIAILASCSWLLIASGAGSGGGNPTDGTYAVYDDLSSSADKSSQLHGIGEQANHTTEAVKLAVISGTLNHKSGALAIDTEGHKFNDADGPNANKAFKDGTSKLSFNATVIGDYKFVTTYQQSYKQGDVAYDVAGIVGIKSKASEISNRVVNRNYGGRMSAILVTSKIGLDIKDANAALIANFETGNIDLSFTDFNALNLENGQPSAVPFDLISVKNMKISGATFSGGELAITKSTVKVQTVGLNQKSDIQGAFFGGMSNAGSLNKQGAPLEAGGQILVQGDDGTLSGTFLAK